MAGAAAIAGVAGVQSVETPESHARVESQVSRAQPELVANVGKAALQLILAATSTDPDVGQTVDLVT